MTPTLEIPTLEVPARRLPLMPPPILIRVPNLAPEPSRSPRHRVRRRRLRREFRVAGCALLVILPLSMALVTLGGDRLGALIVSRSSLGPQSNPDADLDPSTFPAVRISLAPLEPIFSVDGPGADSARAEPDAPVSLGVELMPVDGPEESSDGRH